MKKNLLLDIQREYNVGYETAKMLQPVFNQLDRAVELLQRVIVPHSNDHELWHELKEEFKKEIQNFLKEIDGKK